MGTYRQRDVCIAGVLERGAGARAQQAAERGARARAGLAARAAPGHQAQPQPHALQGQMPGYSYFY